MHLRRRQHEYGVVRRLLQRLEQRVEGRLGQHVHLVHDVDLVPGLVRDEVDLLAQAPYVVYPAVAGGVNLHQVDGAPLVDTDAHHAPVVGLAFLGRQAVNGLCQDARGARLPGSPGAAEHVSLRDPVHRHLVAQRPGDRLLPHDLVQALRTPLPVEDLCHRLPPLSRSSRRIVPSTSLIAAASPSSSWSWPARWARPWTISASSSRSMERPASRACRLACG